MLVAEPGKRENMEGKIFDYDGPVVRATEKFGQLILLNLLTILCSLPVVTFGASFAALDTVVLKMKKDEESYVAKSFFKAFKANLKLGIISSLAILAIIAFGIADYYAMTLLDAWFVGISRVLLIVFGIFFAITVTFLFPVMAKFEAGFIDTVKNAFKFAVSHIFKTLLMLILNLIPWVICYFFNVLGPILFIFGLSVPAYLGAGLYCEEFKKMEEAFYAGKDI